MDDQPPVIDQAKMDALGVELFKMFGVHETDRKAAEDSWMQNLRQFRGIYDPEVKAMIPDDRSKAYPRLTRWKVIGTVARLMQMLFPPNTKVEKNYAVNASPLPDLTTTQLQEVLTTLQNLRAQAQGIDPKLVELKDEEIERAMFDFAAHKAEQMEIKVSDDLLAMEYVTLARKVVFSSALYDVGVLEGPLHKKKKARVWKKDPNTGQYVAQEVTKYAPLYEFCRVWDYYPDLTATTLDKQDAEFKRHIMTHAQVEELAKREDFLGAVIKPWLVEHPGGNYKPKWWESVIKGEPKSDQTNVASKESRKYEALSMWGGVTGAQIAGCGIKVTEEDMATTFQVNAWLLGDKIIKLKLAPFDAEIRHFHTFVFEDDDLRLLGNGQCDTLRDSQLSLCEVTRAMLDNMSVIGPMVIVNDDLLTPGQNTSIRKHKTWHVEDMPSNMPLTSAVSNVSVDSHIQELLALREAIMDTADKESGLPPPSMGDVSGGGSEALRTQGNASMFLGAAALPVRDTVRNFDTFTTSVIKSLVAWNMKYDPNPTRDGDFDVIARGSTSLIAKEVLGASLDAFRATITPDEAPHVKTRGLLEERAKARDIPLDKIMEDEDIAKETIQRNAQAQQSQMQGQEDLVKAQVHKELAAAVALVAKAKKDDASIEKDFSELLLEAISMGHQNDIKAHEADSKRIVAEKPPVQSSAKK